MTLTLQAPMRWTITDCLNVAAVCLAPLLATIEAQESPSITPDVFRRFSDHVVKIQVVETASAAKAGVGSGFFVTDSGHIVTNYHVIAQIVHAPERYRAELIDLKDAKLPVKILAVDVVHDLAVLRSDRRPAKHFTLATTGTEQGERLYALGHPYDYGLSIVEGTYNGHLQHTLYPKIHFTGSLNPGMSGGPTISRSGRVVGVNVSTEGNEVSFLVPAERVNALLARTLEAGFHPPPGDSLLAEVGRQITLYQDVYLSNLFSDSGHTVQLGGYTMPTEPAWFFRCWGDASQRKLQPYKTINHRCSTDDYVYISSEHATGIVDMQHELISSTKLNRPRFEELYSATFGQSGFVSGGLMLFGSGHTSEEEVTAYRCETRNVENTTLKLRVVLCLRRYRKLAGLYDAMLKAAILGSRQTGMVTTLTISGATFDNVQSVTRRYLNSIGRRP